jgi:preprotein translocase subunit SecD
MLIYYRLPGAVASFALIYYTLVVLAIFRLIPVTLTLAGSPASSSRSAWRSTPTS